MFLIATIGWLHLATPNARHGYELARVRFNTLWAHYNHRATDHCAAIRYSNTVKVNVKVWTLVIAPLT